MTIDKFTKAYIEAALWSSNDDDERPLDDLYNSGDLSPELLASMTADCKAFQTAHAHLWAETSWAFATRDWTADEQAGHDFWLTRNGHGAGFWDRPTLYGRANADRLTEACKAFAEVDLYVADGKVHA